MNCTGRLFWFLPAAIVLAASWGGDGRAADKTSLAADKVREAFYADLRQRAASSPEARITDAFPGSREEWLAQARELRRRLRAVFHFPAEDVPLEARTVGRLDRGDFTVEKVIYRVEPDNKATAHLYVPKGLAGPLPAIVLASGHGGSKSAPYNQYFGQVYAKAGCVVLAPDPIGEEERDERCRLAIRGHRQEFRIDRCQAVGISTIGKMVYDIVRGVDYLVSRAEVDRRRIGCAGHSLGGTVTEYAAAVDPRITLSMPTAWTCHFAEIVGSPSCCWRPVGMLRVAGDPELFALGAPHCATLVLAGGDDACPMHVSRFEQSTVPRARRVYRLFDREDCLAVDVTAQAGHQPFQLNRAALAWVEKHFDLPRLTAEQIAALPEGPPGDLLAELTVPFDNKSWDPGRLAAAKAVGFPVRLLPFATLRCLKPGGEAGPEFGMASWVAAREDRLGARFVAAERAEEIDRRRGELRPRLLELLNLPAQGDPARLATRARFGRGSAEVLELEYGRLGLVSYLAVPARAVRAPVAIYLHRSRTAWGGLESARTAELLASGTAVLAIDCVPFEETTYLLGTSPTSYNVSHVLASVDALGRIGGLDLKRVSCIGEVDDVALLAALVDARIGSVTVASASGSRVPKLSYRLDGLVPGLRALADRTELLTLLAPRPLRVETEEPGRPAIERAYDLYGARARLSFANRN